MVLRCLQREVPSFQCSLCRAVWWFHGGKLMRLDVYDADFQCSLCRAVWWFPTWAAARWLGCTSFSAPSVEPYGGSPANRSLPYPGLAFQCSLCRAVWWFLPLAVDTVPSSTSFSAPSVEPYGGSGGRCSRGGPEGSFQCSLCRAVWWFPYDVESGGSEGLYFQCSLCRAVWWFRTTTSYQPNYWNLSVLPL